MVYPIEIAENIYWSFNNNILNEHLFIQKLVDYNKNIENEIDPYEIVLQNPELIVRYYYEEADYETPASNYIDFYIKSNNKKYFTCGELLYKIHENVTPKIELHDYEFFEGLEFYKLDTESRIPIYVLALGS